MAVSTESLQRGQAVAVIFGMTALGVGVVLFADWWVNSKTAAALDAHAPGMIENANAASGYIANPINLISEIF